MRLKMKYKIIKKSEYEFLKHMRVSQGNSIDILDNELNDKTAENVMLQVEIAHAREDVRKMRDKLNDKTAENVMLQVEIVRAREDVRKMRDKLSDAEIRIEGLRRELVAVKAANERLRSMVNN